MHPHGLPKNADASRAPTLQPPAVTNAPHANVAPPARLSEPFRQPDIDFQSTKATRGQLEELRGTSIKASIEQSGFQGTKGPTGSEDDVVTPGMGNDGESSREGGSQGGSRGVFSQNFIDTAWKMNQEVTRSQIPKDILEDAWRDFMRSISNSTSGLVDPSTRQDASPPHDHTSAAVTSSGKSSASTGRPDHSSSLALQDDSLQTKRNSRPPTGGMDPFPSRIDATRDATTADVSSKKAHYDTTRQNLKREKTEPKDTRIGSTSSSFAKLSRTISNAIGFTTPNAGTLKRRSISKLRRENL